MRIQHKRRVRAMIAVTCAMAVAVVVSGCSGGGSDGSEGPETIVTPSASSTPSETIEAVEAVEAVEAIDTSDWTSHTSDRYHSEDGPLVAHPPNWTVAPATREWRLDTDLADPLSPSHESFVSPSGDVRVSVWEVPLDTVSAHSECVDLTGTAFRICVESVNYLQAWVADYCEASGISTPCAGIEDRAVELCLERRDCHPGVLVPFESQVQAFFSGGIYNAEAMTVVAVWRGESDPTVRRFGGAQQLLEGFLSTMQVWPASTPTRERTAGAG